MTQEYDFFAKNTSQALDELKNELYKRLEESRATRIAFETGHEGTWDRGYRAGLVEEIIWLEKLLDKLERS